MVVADGFTGNIALKLYEGMGKFMGSQLKENIFAGANGKLSALLVLPKIKALTKKMDYKAVGGAMMLGVQKPVVKAHGSSDCSNDEVHAAGTSKKSVTSVLDLI